MTKRVFISYQSNSSIAVEGLISVIGRLGDYEVWYDEHLTGGEQWWDEIIAQIINADIVLLVLSNNYLDSKPCRLEREYAKKLGKAIVPIQIDHDLNFNRLHVDIKNTQIIKYHKDSREKDGLQRALDNAQSAPLPHPLPMPPSAPIDDSSNVAESEINQVEIGREETGTNKDINIPIIVAIITAIGAIIVALIGIVPALIGDDDDGSGSPSNTNTIITQGSGNTPITPFPTIEAIAGDFDLSLIYGGRDSFTIRANAESHLFGLTLSSSNSSEIPTDSFSALATLGYVVDSGTCLQYIRSGATPPRPRGCVDNATFNIELLDSELFWYDMGSNQTQDLALRQGDAVISLCSSADSQCDVMSP